MRNFFLYIVLIAVVACSTQKNVTTTAVKDDAGNLVGIATKDNFLKEPYNEEWFSPNYEDYNLDDNTIQKLKPQLKGVTIKAFMGTWCGDSQEQTPIFYKILDATEFNYKNLELVTVDREKKTPDNLQKGYNIERVPTFIFYKNDIEIGRFVEYPRETVEVDMLKIVSGMPYKHSYEE
jgi:thiol-disulfide isomerase/thioredoxin